MSARDDLDKDHYATLGVSKDASAGELKRAYRRLAKDLHPDANPGQEERFKEVSHAYDVLSDPARRKEYDEMRALFAGGGPRRGASTAHGGFSMEDLFSGLGGANPFEGLFGAGRSGRSRAPQRGADLEAEVTIAFADAVRGVAVPVRLSQRAGCSTCRGSGAAPGTTPRTCGVCGGQGSTRQDQGAFAFAEPCTACRGAGQVIDSPCPTCRGTGSAVTERTLTVRVPAGVVDGQVVRVAGRGSPGERGGPAGDLRVTARVSPHPVFGRYAKDPRHLTVTVPVTYAEAVLGAEVPVPTLDEPVTLRVPAGTATGRTFRVKGRGVPAHGKAAAGDLLVTVEVAVPHALSDEAKALLEAFAAAAPDDPREHLREVRL